MLTFLATLKRWVLWFGVVLALFAGSISWYTYRHVHQSIATGPYTFHIKSGTNIRDFSTELVKRGLSSSEWPFLVWAAYKGNTRDIKAGEYRFEQLSTLSEILNQIVVGEVIYYPLTFIEGWTFRQILELLEKSQHLVPDLSTLTSQQIMDKIGSPYTHLEGIFFPDTYFSVRGEEQSVVLRRAHEEMNAQLAKIWDLRIPGLLLSDAYEGLILASIIEKETARDEERAHVAGVLINRLRKNIPLQVDATVIYGLGVNFDGNLKLQHLKLDNPYNTYMRRGLTPTPISNPGLKSLLAAVNPLNTNDLYFVSRGDGSHEFSETLKQHQRAVRTYQLNP
jgi:UPF0755 protein